MAFRSKIVTAVAGLAALCAVLVATPRSNDQAQASSKALVGVGSNTVHSWGNP